MPIYVMYVNVFMTVVDQFRKIIFVSSPLNIKFMMHTHKLWVFIEKQARLSPNYWA